jgi:nitrogen fixation protein NifB
MTVDDAILCLDSEMMINSNLNIVAISGPGEPLYNEATFQTLERAIEKFPHLKMCLSTNGTLLHQSVNRLSKIGLDSISVSMSAVFPKTVMQLYSSVTIGSNRLTGEEIGSIIPEYQLLGIRAATAQGINVKVNSIMIPGINEKELLEVARKIRNAGATLQNIIPLIPRGRMSNRSTPKKSDLMRLRKMAGEILPQFYHCKQCRSDVVGIPGCDRVLT